VVTNEGKSKTDVLRSTCVKLLKGLASLSETPVKTQLCSESFYLI